MKEIWYSLCLTKIGPKSIIPILRQNAYGNAAAVLRQRQNLPKCRKNGNPADNKQQQSLDACQQQSNARDLRL